MKPVKKMSLGELAAYVCTHLNRNNIRCVLSGGACISIYTNNTYQSYDIDFIENAGTSRKVIKNVLAEIDFKEKNRYFINKETKFFIEFPTGPLSIGSEQVIDINELKFSTGKLFLLTPTDSVKDRLAAYYHWNDKQALQQAIWVAENQTINLREIRRWSYAESHPEKYESIKGLLKNKR